METVWELTYVFTGSKSAALSSCAVSYFIIFYLLRQILILLSSLLHVASFTARQSLGKTVLLTRVSLVALAKACLPWSFQILTPPHTLLV